MIVWLGVCTVLVASAVRTCPRCENTLAYSPIGSNPEVAAKVWTLALVWNAIRLSVLFIITHRCNLLTEHVGES